MGIATIKITDKHLLNLDEEIIHEYKNEFGEVIDTKFIRDDIYRDYGLAKNDDDINIWIDTFYTKQTDFDKKMFDRFYEELHIIEIINAAWKKKLRNEKEE